MDARLDELLTRLIEIGTFPGISCSEGHELVDLVRGGDYAETGLEVGCSCTLAARIAELDRLRDMIREFCAGQEFADPAWRKQKHIKPLFDECGYL